MKPGGTGYRVLFIKRTFSPWMVIDEFYQRACHVTLGSNVLKLHYALERKLFFLSFPRRLARLVCYLAKTLIYSPAGINETHR